MNLSFKYTPKPECIGHKLSWPIPKRWAGPIFFKAIVKAQCNQIKLIPPSEIRKSKIKISDLSSHLLPPLLSSLLEPRGESHVLATSISRISNSPGEGLESSENLKA